MFQGESYAYLPVVDPDTLNVCSLELEKYDAMRWSRKSEVPGLGSVEIVVVNDGNLMCSFHIRNDLVPRQTGTRCSDRCKDVRHGTYQAPDESRRAVCY